MTYQRPPANLSDLQRRIARYRRDAEIPPDRLHQRICSEVLFGVLTRAQEDGVIPMFLLKGGMAMELRFGLRARASGDVDVGLLAGDDELVDALDRALAVGFAEFTFQRLPEIERLENVHTYRIEVRILYKGRSFGRLRVDLNEADYETSQDIVTTSTLTELGLPGPLSVPVLDSYLQIAHKIHGATEPSRPDYTNNRYRDLVDVLIFERETPHIDFRALRETVIAEFNRREHHTSWPFSFALPDRWRGPIEDEARDVGLELDAKGLERRFLLFLARIEGVSVKDHYEYYFHALSVRSQGGDPVLQDVSAASLNEMAKDGWRIVTISHNPGVPTQLVAILERPIDQVSLPRLQLRMQTRSLGPGQPSVFDGSLYNLTPFAANKTRAIMSGVDGTVRLGTVTNADGAVQVAIPYRNQQADRLFVPYSAVVKLQYLTDDGRKVEQIGALDARPEQGGTYAYELKGLGPPQTIERFTHRHDPSDEL